MCRRFSFVCALALCSPYAMAQNQPPGMAQGTEQTQTEALPPGLEPIPEPPPLLPSDPPEEGGNITLQAQPPEGEVKEYRIRGKVYMIRVTPPHGIPYYLVDMNGDGIMTRYDATSNLSVPVWVIGSW